MSRTVPEITFPFTARLILASGLAVLMVMIPQYFIAQHLISGLFTHMEPVVAETVGLKTQNTYTVVFIVSFFLTLAAVFFIIIAFLAPVRRLSALINHSNETLQKELYDKKRQIKKLNDHLVFSEEDERKAIASDLHDSVAQTLAMCISRIKNIEDTRSFHGDNGLDKIKEDLEQAVHEIRSLIYKISPPVLDDFEIDIALGFLVESFNEQHQSFFEYTNDTHTSIYLSQPLKITVYRAVSELLTNVIKHAGVKTGTVKILQESNRIIIEVEDHGAGFDPDEKLHSDAIGFGLNSLFERMKNFSGKINVDTYPGNGTKITLILPSPVQDDNKLYG